jgi:hypothetical protein
MFSKLACICGSAFFFLLAPAHAGTYETDGYFPLKVGSSWVYDGVSTMFPGTTPRTKIAQTKMVSRPGELFHGTRTVLLDDDERMLFGADTGQNKWYFSRSPEGTLLHALVRPGDPCQLVLDSPLTYLPRSVKDGETLTGSASMNCNGLAITVTRTAQVLGTEEIVVAAGKFDALKITETLVTKMPDLPPPNTLTERHSSWFADGIGEVKRQWENYDSLGRLAHRGELSLVASNLTRNQNEQKDHGCSSDCSPRNPISHDTGNKFQAESAARARDRFPTLPAPLQ